MNAHDDTLIALLQQVDDPEIPGLSIVDLGIVRATSIHNNTATVVITPTYSGCPALEVMQEEIRRVLSVEGGFEQVVVELQLAPPWSSDEITATGRKILAENGIAPPNPTETLIAIGSKKMKVSCPRCNTFNTSLTGEYGSTACKSLWYCSYCQEPFEYFKAF